MKREINKVNNLLYIPNDDPIMIESLESPVNPRELPLSLTAEAAVASVPVKMMWRASFISMAS